MTITLLLYSLKLKFQILLLFYIAHGFYLYEHILQAIEMHWTDSVLV